MDGEDVDIHPQLIDSNLGTPSEEEVEEQIVAENHGNALEDKTKQLRTRRDSYEQ